MAVKARQMHEDIGMEVANDDVARTMIGVGDGIETARGRWSFSGRVCDSFEAHIGKSVPLYREGHQIITDLSRFFLRDQGVCYELGCSTALLLRTIAAAHADSAVRFIGIDCEADMVERARVLSTEFRNISLLCEDVNRSHFQRADMFMAYYTLQFVHRESRDALVQKIYRALRPGGAFVWFEKIRAPDARMEEIYTKLHTEFKLSNGYSADEIIAKSRSLNGVLDCCSSSENRRYLRQAGFRNVGIIARYLCFEGIIAIK